MIRGASISAHINSDSLETGLMHQKISPILPLFVMIILV